MPMVHQLGDRTTLDADEAAPVTVDAVTAPLAAPQAAGDDWLASLAEARKKLLSRTVELVIELPGRWPKLDGTDGFGTMKARVRPLTEEQDKRLGVENESIVNGDEAGGILSLLVASIAVTELDGRQVDGGTPRGGISTGIARLLDLPADTLPREILRTALDDNPTALKVLGVRVANWLANPKPADDTKATDPFGR